MRVLVCFLIAAVMIGLLSTGFCGQKPAPESVRVYNEKHETIFIIEGNKVYNDKHELKYQFQTDPKKEEPPSKGSPSNKGR